MTYGFIERFVEVERKLADLERRARNRRRTGVVTVVDTAKGLARVKIGDGERPFISPWVPWKEIAAGGIKSHIPPTVGQQVDIVSESGDLTDGVIDFSTPSDANPRPHDGADAVITKGSVRLFISDSEVKVDAPAIVFTASNGSLS